MALRFVQVILWLELLSCFAGEAGVFYRLKVQVIAPAMALPDTQLFISGNQEFLGGWDPGKVTLSHDHDSLWSGSYAFPESTSVEFKITRGAWSKQAIYTVGQIPPNCQLTLSSDTTITLYPVTWADASLAESTTPVSGGITGKVKYHRAFKGRGLDFPRDVIVWLPPSYEDRPTSKFPVLYMHDGQNIIDPSTSFIGYDWHVDEVADSLIRAKKLKEVIIIGVYNTVDRSLEYSDTKKGYAYMEFLVHTLKPFIDSTYRTLPDKNNTGVMGSSMGGLISFLLAWHFPDIFSRAACLSPVFPDSLVSEVAHYGGPDKDLHLYIDMGGIGLEERLQPGCDNMLPVLARKGFQMHENLEWFKDPLAEHNERAWAKRVWRPLTFMFGPSEK